MSDKSKLETLNCSNNKLTSLLMSSEAPCGSITCHNNQLTGSAMTTFMQSLRTFPENPLKAHQDKHVLHIYNPKGSMDGNRIRGGDKKIASDKGWWLCATNQYGYYDYNLTVPTIDDPYVELTTLLPKGSSLKLDGGGWVDLNNNAVIDEGELYTGGPVNYVVGDFQTFKWYENSDFIAFTRDLAAIKVVSNPILEEIQVRWTFPADITVSDCPNLVLFTVNGFRETTNVKEKKISISGCNKLKTVDMTGCNLFYEEINISDCPLLERINVSNLPVLAKFHTSNLPKLSGLSIEETPLLTRLDVNNLSSLRELTVGGTGLLSLDVSNLIHLLKLNVPSSPISFLDVSKNTELTHLICYDNLNLNSLELSNNKKLIHLSCGGTKISSLNLSNNKELISLHCNGSKISSLNLSNNKKLTSLHCRYTPMESIDLSENINLEKFVASDSQFKEVKFAKNGRLSFFELKRNYLKGEKVTNMLLSLPDRCFEEESGNIQFFGNSVTNEMTNEQAKIAIEKNWFIHDKIDLYANLDPNHVTLSTAIPAGQPIRLGVYGVGAWADMNCNKVKDQGEEFPDNDATPKTFTVQPYNSVFKIYGTIEKLNCAGQQLNGIGTTLKVIRYDPWKPISISSCPTLQEADCSNNSLHKLSFEYNLNLKKLTCFNNQIRMTNMTDLINSLPVRQAADNAQLIAIDTRTGANEGNILSGTEVGVPLKGDVVIAKEKNWKVYEAGGQTEYAGMRIPYIKVVRTADKDPYGFNHPIVSATGEDVWIDIDSNGLNDDKGKTLGQGKQTYYIYGMVNTLVSTTPNELDIKQCETIRDITVENLENPLLDLSHLRNLHTVKLSNTKIETLSLPKNGLIKTFSCTKNEKLKQLDLTGQPLLTTLDISSSQLSAIDLSKNTQLTTLDCSSNQLSAIDLSKNTQLTTLDCSKNLLTSFNLHGANPILEKVDVSFNKLTELTVSGAPKLKKVRCHNNNLVFGKVSNFFKTLPVRQQTDSAMVYFTASNSEAENNQLLKSDDLQEPHSKQWKVLHGHSLLYPRYLGYDSYVDFETDLPIGSIIQISSRGNRLDYENQAIIPPVLLEGEPFPYPHLLAWIDSDMNGYKDEDEFSVRTYDKIDVIRFPVKNKKMRLYGNFFELDLSGAHITSIDLSKAYFLEKLNCYGNLLTDLDVSTLHSLSGLEISDNKLTTLDLSNNPLLSHLYCSNNQLSKIIMPPGNTLRNITCTNNRFEGESMTMLMHSLNDQCWWEKGKIVLIDGDVNSKQIDNVPSVNDVNIANNKYWDVADKRNLIQGFDSVRITVELSTAPYLLVKDFKGNVIESGKKVIGYTLLTTEPKNIAKGITGKTFVNGKFIDDNLACKFKPVADATISITAFCPITIGECYGLDIQLREDNIDGGKVYQKIPLGHNLIIRVKEWNGNRFSKLYINNQEVETQYDKEKQEYIASYMATEPIHITAEVVTPKVLITIVPSIGGTTKVFEGDTEILSGMHVKTGTTLKVIATPDENHLLKSITANGMGIIKTDGINIYTDFTVTENTEIKAVFAPKPYPVTFARPAAGGILKVFRGVAEIQSGTMIEHGTQLRVEVTLDENYILKALTANGADIMATKTVTVTGAVEIAAVVESTSGITDIEATRYITLSPNPARLSVTIELAADLQAERIEIADLSGRTVYSVPLTARKMSIEVGSFAKGMYLVRAGNVTKKLIVK